MDTDVDQLLSDVSTLAAFFSRLLKKCQLRSQAQSGDVSDHGQLDKQLSALRTNLTQLHGMLLFDRDELLERFEMQPMVARAFKDLIQTCVAFIDILTQPVSQNDSQDLDDTNPLTALPLSNDLKALDACVQVITTLIKSDSIRETRRLLVEATAQTKAVRELLRQRKHKHPSPTDDLDKTEKSDSLLTLSPKQDPVSEVSPGFLSETKSAPEHATSSRPDPSRKLDLVLGLTDTGRGNNSSRPDAADPSLVERLMHVIRVGPENMALEFMQNNKIDYNLRSRSGITPLIAAIQHEYLRAAVMMIEHGARTDLTDVQKSTPLHWAARRSTPEIARLLLEHGAEVNVEGLEDKITPLLCAAHRGELEIVKVLLQAGANIEAMDRHKLTPLHYACMSSVVVVKHLLHNHCEVSPISTRGDTPLHIAAKVGSSQIVTVLVGFGCLCSAQNSQGNTPVFMAASAGHLETLKTLFNLGGKDTIEIQNRHGLTALHGAIEMRHTECANFLIEHGANLELSSPEGTPLTMAVTRGHLGVAKILLDNGANINNLDSSGNPSLYLAICGRDEAMVRLLLDHGASVLIISGGVRSSCLHAAVKISAGNIAQLLLDCGADVDFRKSDSQATALMIASSHADVETVLLLLRNGAQIEAKNHNGENALHYATKANNFETADALLRRGISHSSPELRAGLTPLHIAAQRGYLKIATTLLNHGADQNLRDAQGRSPLGRINANPDGRCVVLLRKPLTKSSQMSQPERPPDRSEAQPPL